MITKIIFENFNGDCYELPHNILKLSVFSSSKASSLEVNIISNSLEVAQGDKISLYIDENLHFLGKIFSFSKNYDTISLIAYDSLIYFKAHDTFIVKNKTASTVLSEICSKIGVSTGEITNTGYVLSYNLFENMSYFDIIDSILQSTRSVSSVSYLLYDKLGSICLIAQNSSYNTIEIDENFLLSTYEEDCANNVYNCIHVYQISSSGSLSSYYAYDNSSISTLGKLQKNINVDRNLTVAQCNLIANNTLSEYKNSTFYIEIEVIALEIITIFDIIVLNLEKYCILEIILNITPTKETYTLTLEKVVE